MPSPIAHSITGYALFRGCVHHSNKFKRLRKVLLFWSVFIANAADLDFIFQIFGDLQLHRGPTHSITAVFLISAFTALISAIFCRAIVWEIMLFTGCVYGSHLLLDLFTAGGRGMLLFWPISSDFFKSQLPLFPAVHHSRGFFDASHLLFVAYEILYSLALIKLLQRIGSRRSSSKLFPTDRLLPDQDEGTLLFQSHAAKKD